MSRFLHQAFADNSTRREVLQDFANEQLSANTNRAQAFINIIDKAIELVETVALATYPPIHRNSMVIDDLQAVLIGNGLLYEAGEGAHFVGDHVGAEGFKPELRDDYNQVRHAAAGLVIGYRHGSLGSTTVLQQEHQPQDSALYELTMALGIWLGSADPGKEADERRRMLPSTMMAFICDETCTAPPDNPGTRVPIRTGGDDVSSSTSAPADNPGNRLPIRTGGDDASSSTSAPADSPGTRLPIPGGDDVSWSASAAVDSETEANDSTEQSSTDEEAAEEPVSYPDDGGEASESTEQSSTDKGAAEEPVSYPDDGGEASESAEQSSTDKGAAEEPVSYPDDGGEASESAEQSSGDKGAAEEPVSYPDDGGEASESAEQSSGDKGAAEEPVSYPDDGGEASESAEQSSRDKGTAEEPVSYPDDGEGSDPDQSDDRSSSLDSEVDSGP